MALPPTRASGPFRPTRLGQWEVIAKIAGGGMSAVYLGRRAGVDLEPDSPKVVALKIVRHDVRMDDRLLKMFLEEGKLIARLVHPNIVQTLEVGGDGEQEFIAMELMLGKTFAPIHDTLAARDVRLSPEIAAWTAARVADALHYAHELTDENGQPLALVHRDVNPANVFATFNGEVKLFDFGLAKVTAGEASGSHVLAGKLSYLSPEQIMQMPLDRRSDIFSLGTTLWELLTGKRLFRRESDIDTVRAVQLGPIPDPRQVAPEIPEELARITRTALERNREHRYPTGAYLARELDAFVFTRTSPNDVTARLATLVDTLFPGEQKRQSGWLKPAISGSITRSSTGPASLRSASVSPSSGPRERSLTPREITAVMPNAPQKRAEPSASANAHDVMGTSPQTALGPINAFDALEALEMLETKMPATDPLPSTSSLLGDVGPLTPREGTPSVIPGPPTSRESRSPGSFTAREGIPSVRPASLIPQSPSAAPPSMPPSMPPSGPLSGRSWPLAANRPAPSVPPPPQRSRPPGPRVTAAPPPSDPIIAPPTPSSRTDIQAMPIPPPSRTDVELGSGAAAESARLRQDLPPVPASPEGTASVSIKPAPVLPSGGPLSARGRLPRKPIPLPSSSRKMIQDVQQQAHQEKGKPRDSSSRITEPPDSDTQVDMPVPPDRKRS